MKEIKLVMAKRQLRMKYASNMNILPKMTKRTAIAFSNSMVKQILLLSGQKWIQDLLVSMINSN